MHTRLKCVEGLNKTEDNIFSVKTFKTTRGLGGWCIPNALNLENLEWKIHNFILLLNFLSFFSLYPTHGLIS